MTTDRKIQEAIEAAVKKEEQDPALAKKLVRWFDAIASGNEDITDTDSADRHLELLYEATQAKGIVPFDLTVPDEEIPPRR